MDCRTAVEVTVRYLVKPIEQIEMIIIIINSIFTQIIFHVQYILTFIRSSR